MGRCAVCRRSVLECWYLLVLFLRDDITRQSGLFSVSIVFLPMIPYYFFPRSGSWGCRMEVYSCCCKGLVVMLEQNVFSAWTESTVFESSIAFIGKEFNKDSSIVLHPAAPLPG